MLKVLGIIAIVLICLWILSMIVYFFNLDMKLTSALQPLLAKHYDKIKKDLKPAKMRFNVHVEKYASKSLASSAKKNLKNPNRLDEW